jgi:O-succinylhomoserine sulfhydrylase
MKFETKAIRLQTNQTGHKEHSTPIFPTSSFTFENAEQMAAIFSGDEAGNIYSRFTNPTVREFEVKMAALEDTEDAFATASGMAAVFATFAAFLKQGDHILSSRAIFGSTNNVITDTFPKWGVSYSWLDVADTNQWEQAVRPNTKLIYIETPSNPGLDIIELRAISKFAADHHLVLIVDNCFATPYLQQPCKLGASLSIHSATKYIDGQGRVLGGVVCGSKDHIQLVRNFCRRTGPALSPFNAWILSKSLETLAVRMDRHCQNALSLAKYLQTHPELEWVKYPFLDTHPSYQIALQQMKAGGGIVSFGIRGGLEAGKKFLNNIQMMSLTANLGDTRTIATHPASTTHSRVSEEDRNAVGITQNLIRISVGLEHIDDIIQDVEHSLRKK